MSAWRVYSSQQRSDTDLRRSAGNPLRFRGSFLTLGDVTLGKIPIETVNHRPPARAAFGTGAFPDEELAPGLTSKLFQRVKPPRRSRFYSV